MTEQRTVGASCGYCGKSLSGTLGFYFTCHVCNASYCYIHMRRHEGRHRQKMAVPAE